jgi:hypothetical protein
VEGSGFDEDLFFGAIARSGARALLIGRRALVALGIPVLTADYDFWIHIDDIATFNQAAASSGLHPSSRPPHRHQAFRSRPKDLEVIRLLEALRSREGDR